MIFNAGGAGGGGVTESKCIANEIIPSASVSYNGSTRTLVNVNGKGRAIYLPTPKEVSNLSKLTIVITVDGVSKSITALSLSGSFTFLVIEFAKSCTIKETNSNSSTITGGACAYQLFE